MVFIIVKNKFNYKIKIIPNFKDLICWYLYKFFFFFFFLKTGTYINLKVKTQNQNYHKL